MLLMWASTLERGFRLVSVLISFLIQVPYEAFVTAAKSIKRQITPEILADFEIWRKGEGS